VLEKGVQQSELIISHHAMARKTHLEALVEQAKELILKTTTERRARQACDYQVTIDTRMMKI
tara:strand:+ start:82 stop:267 length:186 start_codon:yes stop_codon:yes gene_type:complete